jgi:hypothetical protein
MSVEKMLSAAKDQDLATFKEDFSAAVKAKILTKIQEKRENLFKTVSDA